MKSPFDGWVGLATLCLYSIVAQAMASPLIITGLHEPPYKMVVDGQLTGIDIRMMERVLDELDIEYEFQMLGSGSRLLQLARTGQVDVVMSLSHNAERAEYMAYPARSYKYVSWHFFVRQEDAGKIAYNALPDLMPWRIGAVRSWAYTPEFWEQDFNLTLVTDHRLLPNMLRYDRIDAAPMSTVETLLMIRELGLESHLTFLPKPLVARPYFNTFSKQSDHPGLALLQAEYDRVIGELEASGFIDDLYREYLGRTIDIE